MPLSDRNPDLSITRTTDLLNTDKTVSDARNYLNKLNRSLLYRNKKYSNPLPSSKEGDDLDFRFQFLVEWDTLNKTIRGLDPKLSQQVLPIDDPFFSSFRNSHSILSRAFNMMKDEIKDADQNRRRSDPFDPSKTEQYSPTWCVSRVFDLSRSLFSNVEKQLSSISAGGDVAEGRMMGTLKGSDQIKILKPHFNVLSPILENKSHPDRNIVNQIKECQDRNVFRDIFNNRLSGTRELISPSEVNIIFNQFVGIGLDQAQQIQKIAWEPIGVSLKKSFSENKIK